MAKKVKEEVVDIVDGDDTEIVMPERDSHEWSPYVLGLLEKDEKIEGNPTTDGLARVARKLLGDFDSSIVVHHISRDYAAVTVTLCWYQSSPPKNYQLCGSAEVHSDNCEPPYSQYPLATAETRATGRALRSALGLRKIITAEEGSRRAKISIPFSDEQRTEGPITEIQVKFIDMVCKKHDWSIADVMESVLVDTPKVSLTDIQHNHATQVQETLDDWSRNGNVPTTINCYNPNWKATS